MIRTVLFLVLLGLAALAAAWIVDQPGDLVLTWNDWRIETSLGMLVLGVLLVTLGTMLAWWLIKLIWRMPTGLSKARHRRRAARARHAITHGLIAIGAGDRRAAQKHEQVARRLAQNDPLTLLLQAQTAQMVGDGATARRTFEAMAKRDETKLIGLRGLFIEAQRRHDAPAAMKIAEQAVAAAPASEWASRALLGFRGVREDWQGALALLATNRASGLIDKATHDRQRAVILTAQALELAATDRAMAQKKVNEAVALAPTLVPAAVLAARFWSEGNQIRKAMRTLETAWRAGPHPDIADAYAHVRLGDSARGRLARAEQLAAETPGHIEGALGVARAALAASEFGRARAALEPFLEAPTRRTAALMAEIDHAEHGDSAAARGWMMRALTARQDPVWSADGTISDRWRPVSPVTGAIDAFQWMVPLETLSSPAPVVEAEVIAIGDAPAPAATDMDEAGDERAAIAGKGDVIDDDAVTAVPGQPAAASSDASARATPAAAIAATPVALPDDATHAAAPDATVAASAIDARAADGADDLPPPPAVIPVLRAPDDPGIDGDPVADPDYPDRTKPDADRRTLLQRLGF